eukprot:1554394-Rhodomonas_salina.3
MGAVAAKMGAESRPAVEEETWLPKWSETRMEKRKLRAERERGGWRQKGAAGRGGGGQGKQEWLARRKPEGQLQSRRGENECWSSAARGHASDGELAAALQLAD